MKYILCFCLCALTFVSISESAPQFTKNTANRPDVIDKVMYETIERENLTCDNLHYFCYGDHSEDADVAVEMARKACELFLLPYLCTNKQ